MKRTWVVYISSYDDSCISEAAWFGPYTEREAKGLAEDLSGLFLRNYDENDYGALDLVVAMPLEHLTPRKLKEHIAQIIRDYPPIKGPKN